MLLNDIGKSSDTTLKKINQHLEINYGFKIAENASDRDLVAIMEQIEGEITDLKLKGNDSRGSSEISKRLLILEGIKVLREFSILQFQSPDFENVVNGMCNFVCDNFRLGGMHHADFEEAVKDAMKHYRSSKYRFPDDLIEQRIRQGAMKKIQDLSETPGSDEGSGLNMESMFEDDNEGINMKKLTNEAGFPPIHDPWDQTPKGDRPRDTAKGGGVPTIGPGGKKVIGKLNIPPEWDIKPEHGLDVDHDPLNKRGKNFMAPAPKRVREGNIVKEKHNLVKNLRRILESEVMQADAMMQAKEFSKELQEMIEKIGRLQNEKLPPCTDLMRETYGYQTSEAFQTQIHSALQDVMSSLYMAKDQVDDAVTNLATTGQVSAQTDMDVPVDGMEDPNAVNNLGADLGADIDADVGADVAADLDNIEGDADEFGGAEEEEPLGRAMKESLLREKVIKMRRLVEKARALREARA